MSQALQQLLTDPIAWAAFAVLAGAMHLYFRQRVSSAADEHFADRLRDHEQSLRVIAESARYQLGQELAQTNLYSVNAHAAAVQLYRSIRVAHRSCLNLRSRPGGRAPAGLDREDLAVYMASCGVPHGKQQEILTFLGIDRPRAMKELAACTKRLNAQRADRDLGEARKTAYLNELYFDDDVIVVIDAFFDEMGAWVSQAEYSSQADEWGPAELHAEEITEALVRVRTALRRMLRGTASPLGAGDA